MKMQQLGEFGLIDRIRKMTSVPDPSWVGIGDDCAVIPLSPETGGAPASDLLVSTDMLVEGTHFLMEDISPRQLGWKSAAVNISDIAAMGGKPIATFLSLALPKTLPEQWMQEFMEGYNGISEKYGAALLGGDTTCSPDRICINVAVLGTCPRGKARLRSAARPGDLVCVTGTLGDSAAGLRLILGGQKGAAPRLMDRHYTPTPRVEEGLALSCLPGVHAMMDISDGVGSDLRHILDESGVGARIDTGKLPISKELQALCSEKGWDPKELALSGGEDYELLFTMDPQETPDIPYTVIGEITANPTVTWEGGSRDYMGYKHF
ncbi:MAG: thiamine-phosphate kinase [Candidatus Cryptobacteroides sp.]